MAKTIMIQGTASNAGKSLLVAALCRIFRQDGLKVAPFKSQNMALNSYVTSEGLEMGRAQVMQAEAAGIVPSVNMNPILLKPTSESGSQVIVNGEVLGNMPAKEYFRRKKEFIPSIMKAFHYLETKYDIIILEGAGSPAEINLKQEDIVNMGMAKLVDAPVLLVGDIDRGGVFASLAGTMLLLEEEERARIKGLIINKFRGDRTILQPGLDQISQITKTPVIGVIPHLNLELEDEDSLTTRFDKTKNVGLLDIVVVNFPRISNFTDFNSLEYTQGVSLRYVSTVRQLGMPDMIILPGSKSTIDDLLWMRQSGIESAILKLCKIGTLIAGICGGYQMLGKQLQDPECIESNQPRRIHGMGILPTTTIFTRKKTLTQVAGHFANNLPDLFSKLSGVPFTGYEIHMGQTTCICGSDIFAQDLTTVKDHNGLQYDDGLCINNVFGSYVHGILDGEEVIQSLINMLCAKKGIDPGEIHTVNPSVHKEQQYDKLAQAVRENLDMDTVYRIIKKQ